MSSIILTPVSASWPAAVIALLVAGAGLGAAPGGQQAPARPGAQLFLDLLGETPPAAPSTGPAILRSRAVRIDWGVLELQDGRPPAAGRSIRLNLFPDAQFTAVPTQVERPRAGSLTWTGRVEGIERSRVTLVVNGDALAGSVTVPGRFFRVRYAGNGVHVVQEVDQSQFPPEAPPVPR